MMAIAAGLGTAEGAAGSSPFARQASEVRQSKERSSLLVSAVECL